ncbi:MAG: hypothetical protein ACOCVF_02315 [bacterium]
MQETRLKAYKWEYKFKPTAKFQTLTEDKKIAYYQFMLMNEMAKPKILFNDDGFGEIVVEGDDGKILSSTPFAYITSGSKSLTISQNGTVSNYILNDNATAYKLILSEDETINEVLEVYLHRIEKENDAPKEEKKENSKANA